MSDFKKYVLNECESEFKKQGFYNPRKNCILFQLNKGFYGWVGMNTAINSGTLEINPFVGVHCKEIMEIRDFLWGSKYKLGDIATFAVHFGSILPTADSFLFYHDKPEYVHAEASRLVSSITKYGIPYMEKISTLDNLIHALEGKLKILGGFPESYAIALYKNNETERCLQFLNEHSGVIRPYGGAIASKFYDFKIGLLNLINGKI